MKKLFDERELVKKVLEQEVREPGLILHYCENTEIDRSNLQIFQRTQRRRIFPMNTREVSERNFLTITVQISGERIWTII